MALQTPETPRKLPTQRRARATVDAIVLAAAHILKTEGRERATTNRIAERAGVSIGSLYQYFPNKAAVFAELRRRHSQWFDGTLREEAARSTGPSLREAVRPSIERVVALHRVDTELHNALAEGEHGVPADIVEHYAGLLQDFLIERASELRPLDPETTSFIILRALEAVIHGTALEDPARLDDPAFTDEVVELMVRFIEA